MNIITIGIDLAKNIFAVHGVNESGKAELVKPKVPRDPLLPLIANLPPCRIGMEACSGAHHWARLFMQHDHTVRLIAPKFVTPYRMTGKRGKPVLSLPLVNLMEPTTTEADRRCGGKPDVCMRARGTVYIMARTQLLYHGPNAACSTRPIIEMQSVLVTAPR